MRVYCFLLFYLTATPEIYTDFHTLTQPDALPIWHDDEQMDMPPRRAEIAGGLDLVAVGALDRVVQREHHHQQVGIGQPGIEPDIEAEEVDRRVDQEIGKEHV